MDALQIFVRGFETREAGDQIIKILNELGFEIAEAIDGSGDTRGGIIGTRIMPTDELETDDLDEIDEAVAVTDQTFIQYRKYRLHGEGERPTRLAVVRCDDSDEPG
jgi:hypothetical protein